MQVTPRPYQSMAVKAALEGLQSPFMRALVVMATGLGKTLTAALIAKKFCAKRILFLVHNNFILEHAMDEFHLVFSEETKMSIYNGMSKNGATEAEIVFATWQTMGKALKKWKRNHFDLIIVDEAHHTEAGTYRPVVNYFIGSKLGITATPDRGDEADIREVFGAEVVDITLEEAIARGWLPRIEYHVITDESLNNEMLQKIVAEIRKGKKRFTMAEVNRRIFIKKRDEEIAKIINSYDEKAVVFCASITHAERMARVLSIAATFHSKIGKGQKDTWNINQATLDDLESGLLQRVCAVNAFNEGVNVPSIGLVAFCRVTGVLTVFRQQLGRGLRPGKDKLIVLDFVGNLERIQLVLAMMNKISDLHERYTLQKEREGEGYMRERFEVSGKGFEFTFSDKIVDLMKVLEHCEREFYPTWQEASEVAIHMSIIRSQDDYRSRYKEDPRLPSSPEQTYSDFPGYDIFLGRYYNSVEEASVAAQNLGISSSTEYPDKYKGDSRLNSAPDRYYKDFPGWTVFLGKSIPVYYEKWKEASAAAHALRIPNRRVYPEMRKADSRLPPRPQYYYKEFPGWRIFLGTLFYDSWKEAGGAAVKLGVSSCKNYGKISKKDPKLPSSPHHVYEDFPGWKKFLGKE